MTPDIDTAPLLAELEALTHADRVRRMIALGRQAQTDARAAATLRALASGTGFYERFLGLLSCSGSRDGAHVVRSLSDASRLLRGLALRLVPTVCTDEQAAAALDAAPREAQAVLLRGLLRRRRAGAIDAFLDRLSASGDERLGPLLPFGSADAVRRHLGGVLPRFGLDDWQRLARLHPDTALDLLRERVGAQTEPEPRLLSHANVALRELGDRRPDESLALVRELLRHEPPARLALDPLARRRPNEIADLLLASEGGASATVNLGPVAHRLAPERLLALLERLPSLLPRPGLWLRRLPPDLRRSVYELAGRGWRTREGVVGIEVVSALPADLREREARRHLALPALATRPPQRLPYAAFLPWDEARAALDPFVRNPDADLRAAALSALIGAARYQRERLGDALALVRARTNEQDPVRRAMLSALAALLPSRWRAEHLEDLGRILREALDAADLSHNTAGEAQKLVVALVPFHPGWAAPWLGTLVKERGQLSFWGLGDRLSDADVQRIAPALLPVLQSWETREREPFLVQAAVSLGRRLRAFDALADILERVAMTTRQNYVASQILSLLAEHRRDRLAALIPALLQRDASAITLPVVYDHLHRRRQDLLAPFLGQQAYAGRFGTGRTRFVLPLASGFHRWTRSQQETFAQTLDRVTRDNARDTPAVDVVIRQLAALPAVFPSRLLALADRRMERLAVRDAALRALARLDAGQGVPALVEALDDERGRVAIYALRAAILEMPAGRALTLLRGVRTEKVTVAKEVVRLLGDLHMPDAYPLLLEWARRDGLHRDVRVALLRALWEHPERDETWPILDAAAADPDPAVAAGVVRVPADRLSPAAQRRLLGLIAALLGHGDPKVRLDALGRCADLPLPDPGRALLPPLLGRLSSPLPDESAAAARAVFATYAGRTAQDAGAVGVAVGRVRADRRALLAAVGALQSAIPANRVRLVPTVRAVLDALADDPPTARWRAELAVAGLPWGEVTAYLSALAASGELHPEALMAAVAAVERSTGPHRPPTGGVGFADLVEAAGWEDDAWEEEDVPFMSPGPAAGEGSGARGDAAEGLPALEAALAASGDAGLRRLALAALFAQASATRGWTGALRARLDGYRRDPAPLVAAAAQFILLPPEGDEEG